MHLKISSLYIPLNLNLESLYSSELGVQKRPLFPVKAYHSHFSLTIIQKPLPCKQQITPSELISAAQAGH